METPHLTVILQEEAWGIKLKQGPGDRVEFTRRDGESIRGGHWVQAGALNLHRIVMRRGEGL